MLAVVVDFPDGTGGAEGAGAGAAFLLEARPAGPVVGIAPLAQGVGEVGDGAVGDSVRDLGEEGELVVLHLGDGLAELGDGGPR